MSDRTEYKYQWSKKIGEEVIVVRSDEQPELEDNIEFARRILGEDRKSSPSTSAESPVEQESRYNCATCGAPAEIVSGTSKAGNPYRIFKCSKAPELTDKGGHSKFLPTR